MVVAEATEALVVLVVGVYLLVWMSLLVVMYVWGWMTGTPDDAPGGTLPIFQAGGLSRQVLFLIFLLLNCNC